MSVPLRGRAYDEIESLAIRLGGKAMSIESIALDLSGAEEPGAEIERIEAAVGDLSLELARLLAKLAEVRTT